MLVVKAEKTLQGNYKLYASNHLEVIPVFKDKTFDKRANALAWFLQEFPLTASTDGKIIYWDIMI